MTSDMLLRLAVGLLVVYFLKYLWKKREFYYLSYKLPGPIALPIIGNAWIAMCHNSKILRKLSTMIARYKTPIRFWLGPQLMLVFTEPKHAEKIMTSSKIAYKHEVYDFMIPILGNGIINDSGSRYRQNRRLLQPMYNKEFVSNCLPSFRRHMSILTENLSKHVEKGTFNIEKYLHFCFADLVGTTILGIELNSQKGENHQFVDAMVEMYDLLYTRIVKPWLYPNVCFNISSVKEKFDFHLNHIHKLLREHVSKHIKDKESDEGDGLFVPSVRQIIDLFDSYPDNFNEKNIIYHLLTMYSAAEDTMSFETAFACMCLGMNPSCQQRVVDEIKEVIGEDPREVSYDELSRMTYLDMCVKEVLRLFPVAPFILRRTVERVEIDGINCPPGLSIMFSIFNTHRNHLYWEKPNDFYPEHFLPESISKRPTYAYLAFSAGTRGCIGKFMGYAGVKLALINILQKFVIEADGTVAEIPLKADISTRPIHGYNVRLKKREWV